MVNRELYELLNKLGMIDCDYESFEKVRTDLVDTINLVEDITISNDLETIKKFLVCLIYEA